MKFFSLLALAGLAFAGTLKVKRDDIDASGELILDSLAPNSKFTIGGKQYVSKGVEQGTNVTVFQQGGSYYSLEFAQGPKVENIKIGANGVCEGCRDDAGSSITQNDDQYKRDLVDTADHEKRFFFLTLIAGILNFKLRLLGNVVSHFTYGCFRNYYPPIYIHRPHGGGHGHGDWCGVDHNGYIHWPNVHIGCQNGLGGHYVGCTDGGMQLWQWGDGSICPIYVRRGRRHNGWSNGRYHNWWYRSLEEASEE